MMEIDDVLTGIERGAKIRLVHDRYGREKIMMRLGWLPIWRQCQLSREDREKVRTVLRSANRGAAPSSVVKI